MTTADIPSKTTSTPEQWQDAIAKLNDWLETGYDQAGEDRSIEEIRYEPERHRLAVAFEDQFAILIAFNAERNYFCAAAWQDNSLDGCLEGNDGGVAMDEDSLKVLEVTYLLPCEGYENGNRTLMIRDPYWSMDYASPGQTSLFIHLIDRLIEFGEIHVEPYFQFGMIQEYSEMQQIFVRAVELLRGGLRESWCKLGQDWNYAEKS